MKVLDLRCAHGHLFEGWFASEHEYQSQLGRDLVACPVCGDTDIEKRLSAPRINLGAAAPAAVPAGPARASAPRLEADSPAAEALAALPEAARQELQAAFLRAVRHAVSQTEDVGQRFAEEARRIHYGEAEDRGIRGRATPDEAEALLDEGIAVVQMPLPEGLDGPLH